MICITTISSERTGSFAGVILCLVLALLLAEAPFAAARAQTDRATGPSAEEETGDVAFTLPCSDQLRFADALRAEGDYFRAITEYKRVLHFCGSAEVRARARMGIGDAAFSAGRYALVSKWYDDLGPGDVDAGRAGLLAGRALFRTGSYDDAAFLLQSLSEDEVGSAGLNEARYYAGLSLVQSLDMDGARFLLEQVDDTSEYGEKARRYVRILRGHGDVPRKDPRVAAALAVVPGAGYVYTEHYGTALASAVVNGLLWWATASAFSDGNDGAGGFYSLLAVGFYVGNITGSSQSATRYNDFHVDRFLAAFKE